MEEKEMVREKFEKEIDSVIFRSVPRDVFAFLKEQQDKRLITLYAGTYSFDMAVEMCKGDSKATFYFYLNVYNYGYSLSYFQGRFRLERDERIFFKDHKKQYTKKALSSYKIDKRDMRSGEYYANKKSLIRGAISEGLLELLLYFVGVILFGSVGTGIVFLLDIENDVDFEIVLLLGFLALVIIAVFVFIIVAVTKSLRDAKKEQKNEK